MLRGRHRSVRHPVREAPMATSNVETVIHDRVTLTVDGIDRLPLNGCAPTLQTPDEGSRVDGDRTWSAVRVLPAVGRRQPPRLLPAGSGSGVGLRRGRDVSAPPGAVCLNGHERAEQRARQVGLGCTSLDGGPLACDGPERPRVICDGPATGSGGVGRGQFRGQRDRDRRHGHGQVELPAVDLAVPAGSGPVGLGVDRGVRDHASAVALSYGSPRRAASPR